MQYQKPKFTPKSKALFTLGGIAVITSLSWWFTPTTPNPPRTHITPSTSARDSLPQEGLNPDKRTATPQASLTDSDKIHTVIPVVTVGASGELNPAQPIKPEALAQAKPAAPVPACYTISFTHKPTAGHTDRDTCSEHRNLVKFDSTAINPKAMCVRVDGTPVPFESVKGGLLIAPIAGPKSKITVRYCTGKISCNEECKIKRDTFMEGLGNTNDQDETKDQDVGNHVEAEMAQELADHADLAIFDGWLDAQPVIACTHGLASNSK